MKILTFKEKKAEKKKKVSFECFPKPDESEDDEESSEDGDGSVGRLEDADQDLEEIERNPEQNGR